MREARETSLTLTLLAFGIPGSKNIRVTLLELSVCPSFADVEMTKRVVWWTGIAATHSLFLFWAVLAAAVVAACSVSVVRVPPAHFGTAGFATSPGVEQCGPCPRHAGLPLVSSGLPAGSGGGCSLLIASPCRVGLNDRFGTWKLVGGSAGGAALGATHFFRFVGRL